MTLSFLRVEDFLIPLFGENLGMNLGKSVFRGTYIHFPLIIIAFIALIICPLSISPWAAFGSAIRNLVRNNKINIALAKVDGDSIFGHSVCAGNFRSIKGTIEIKEADVYSINMMEPGDNKYDGEFQFEIDVNKKELIGAWKPYKKNVLPKENYTYTLYRRDFVYNTSAGDHTGSIEWLEPMDVENLLPEEIELIRNEIYARHGYSFTNLKMRRHFDPKEWYIPMSIDIRDQLTETEAHNIDMLYNYEEYYDEYYNEFGR